MQELEIFKNEEFGEIRTVMIDDDPWFVGKDVAIALGYGNTRDALAAHVDDEDKAMIQKSDFPTLEIPNRGMVVINESGLYSLILSSKLPNAKRFKHWVTSEVLPIIRKTGGYVNNDDLFINTYLPFADNNTKLLFSTTLRTIRNQNEQLKLKDETIAHQKDEIAYKQEVINGLTDDTPVYKKKDVINRICRRRSGNYANRYKELYKCFRENFHTDLEVKCENYNAKQIKKKDRLSIVKYAEQFGYIDNLYSCCAKLFESEIDEVLDQINSIRNK